MSIEVTDELVHHIARLARLSLSEEEAERMKDHFRKVLAYVEELQDLDTSGVDASPSGLEAWEKLREDRATPSLSLDAVLAVAAAAEKPYFLVPRIVAALEGPEAGAGGRP
jgi:aspartyl-tRNA(Asn)/glutamyl-tRNA(Gln) amidotransferase subunit C